MRTGTSQQAASYFVLKFHVLSKAIRCFAVGIRYEDNKSDQSSLRSVRTSRDTAILMDSLLPAVLTEGLDQLEGINWNEESEELSRYNDYATGWTVRGSNPTRVRGVSLLQNVLNSSGAHLFCSVDTMALSWRYNGRAVKLTAHLHPVQRLRMSGAVPLLLLYAGMTWTTRTNWRALDVINRFYVEAGWEPISSITFTTQMSTLKMYKPTSMTDALFAFVPHVATNHSNSRYCNAVNFNWMQAWNNVTRPGQQVAQEPVALQELMWGTKGELDLLTQPPQMLQPT